MTANAATALPPVDVSALQGRMLAFFVQIAGARCVLEQDSKAIRTVGEKFWDGFVLAQVVGV